MQGMESLSSVVLGERVLSREYEGTRDLEYKWVATVIADCQGKDKRAGWIKSEVLFTVNRMCEIVDLYKTEKVVNNPNQSDNIFHNVYDMMINMEYISHYNMMDVMFMRTFHAFHSHSHCIPFMQQCRDMVSEMECSPLSTTTLDPIECPHSHSLIEYPHTHTLIPIDTHQVEYGYEYMCYSLYRLHTYIYSSEVKQRENKDEFSYGMTSVTASNLVSQCTTLPSTYPHGQCL